ncbi:MAG: AAA family ATPase, partial [Candidatus Acidiferrales bacterium]
MLKLRKVELLGFKSFCEKTPITFSGTGITCIVGPNGCGKSNVVDAISWVLGEQSHKMLRAERMSDCIFNGTAKRPPMGLSEVTLTLVDPDLANAVAQVMDAPEESAAAVESAGPMIVENPPEPETKVVDGFVELVADEIAPEANAAAEPAEAEKGKPWKKRGAEKPAIA